MKKINIFKISLDLLMAVVFALLFNKIVLGGIRFHEIAGLAIGFAVVIHLVINGRWIKQVSLNLFSKKISIKTRIGYILNVLLLFGMGLIIISGIFISKELFPSMKIGNSMVFKTLHISVSYLILLLIGVHVGLHWDWVMNLCKRMFGITGKKKVLGYIAKIAVILVLAFGSYNLYSTNFFLKASGIVTVVTGNQGAMPNKEIGKMPPSGTNGNPPMQEGAAGRHQGPGNGMQRPPNGQGGEGGPPSVNVFNVLATNLGIIAVFSVLTYYFDKLLTGKRVFAANN